MCDRAALKGYESVAQLLLEAGAFKEAKNNDGYTPLHWAAHTGHEAVTRVLLEAGADMAAEDNRGRTPLDMARLGHRAEIVALLNRDYSYTNEVNEASGSVYSRKGKATSSFCSVM